MKDEALPFGILSDEKRTLIKALGLVHEKGGPAGRTISRPAHLLIDKDGTIVWRYVPLKFTDRPDTSEILTAIASIG